MKHQSKYGKQTLSNLENTNHRQNFAEKAYKLFQRSVIVYVTLFFTSIIIARTLGPEMMGLWSVLLMLPNYAAAIGRTQIDVASVQLIASKLYPIEELSFAILTLTVTAIFIIFSLLFWQQDLLFETIFHLFDEKKYLIYWTAISIPFDFLSLKYAYLFLATEDIKSYNRQNILTSLLSPVCASILLLLFEPRVEYLIGTLILGKFVSLIHGATLIHKKYKMICSFDLNLYKTLLTFGLKLYVGSVLSFISTYIAGLIVVLYTTPIQVAFHQIAQRRALMLGKVSSASSSLLYPRISSMSHSKNEAVSFTADVFRINLMILIIFGITAAALSYPGIFILYGSDYVGMTLPLMVFLPGIVMESSTSLFTNYFLGIKKGWTSVIFHLSSILPQIGLLWWLIPMWEATGGAISTSVAFMIASLVRLIMFQRHSQLPFSQLLLFRTADASFVYIFIKHQLEKHIPHIR